MELSRELQARFPPSRGALLECAVSKVDDAGLAVIAKADYGFEAAEMSLLLGEVRRTKQLPQPFPWMLGEVLRLSTLLIIDRPAICYFACAALLTADDPDETGWVHEHDHSLAQCLVAARMIDVEASAAIGHYLAWRVTTPQRPDDAILSLLGLLIVALREPADCSPSSLSELAGKAMAREAADSNSFAITGKDPPPPPFGLLHGAWEPLRRELLEAAGQVSEARLRDELELCSLLLLSSHS